VEVGTGTTAPAPSEIASQPLRWSRADTVILLSLLVLAGMLRFVRLAEPSSIVFDETYYARDACLYLGHTQQFCGSPGATEQSYVHPPLAKWIIAGGIKVFGFDAFGWRVMAALLGTALVGVVYLLTRTLFRRRLTAALAGFLVATDFLLFVQSRIAMLDIFLAFFVALGFLFLALDREHVQHLLGGGELLPGEPRRRWLRVAAGVAFGAAMACKWSAILAIGGAVALSLAWSVSLAATRAQLPRGERPPGLVGEMVLTFFALGVVPLLVYLASYGVWLAQHHFDLRGFVQLQQTMLNFHETLRARHAYQSSAWQWPIVRRPVAYHYQGTPKSSEVLDIGNVVTWYAALVAGGWLLVRSLRSWRPERFVAAAWGAQYVPWLFVTRPLFFFYMTPIVPFMMIGLAAGLTRMIDAGRLERWLVGGFLVIGVGVMLWFFYPVLAAVPIPYDLWHSRMWFPTWI
jgi:dolichyl-phosphate-mannose-protein mannosyltransferase